MTNAEFIWNFLMEHYKNPYGVAGLMGNLYAESGLNPKNLQNSYSKKLGMTDEEYTNAVDSDQYPNFAKDSAGYGLAQWTYSARKLNLLTYTRNKKVSIGDLTAQLEFLIKELTLYNAIDKALKESKSIQDISNLILTKYERPADQSQEVKNKRAKYGEKYYNQFMKKEEIQVANYDKYINSTSTHYLSNSGGDERGKLNSGQAGDQTGKEWQLRAWYNRPWTHVFRYEKDPRVGETLCNLGCAAALNNNIGYDQYQRTTYWTQLQKVGYDPAKITTKCEEDCSAGVAANVKAAGYILGIKALQDVSSSMTSRNTVSNLTKAGFTVLTDRKYLINGDYLQPGDILLYVNHHVSMNITKGKKAEATIVSKPIEDLPVIGTAIAKGNMRVRQSPNTSAYAYGTIKVNNIVEVVEITSDNWYKIKYKGSPTSYAYTSNRNNLYYKYSDLKKEDTTRYITTGSVNLRKDAGTDKKILVALSKGTEVEVLSNSKTVKNVIWHEVQVTYKKINYRGYISSRYLKRV